MSKRITSITMGLLALMLMLATPSFAQKKSSLDVKAKKTTAFEQANMRAEFYKQHPAMAPCPDSNSSFSTALRAHLLVHA